MLLLSNVNDSSLEFSTNLPITVADLLWYFHFYSISIDLNASNYHLAQDLIRPPPIYGNTPWENSVLICHYPARLLAFMFRHQRHHIPVRDLISSRYQLNTHLRATLAQDINWTPIWGQHKLKISIEHPSKGNISSKYQLNTHLRANISSRYWLARYIDWTPI